MIISTIQNADKQIMKVYAARDYDITRPRTTNKVEVNIPEYMPALPKDEYTENFGLSSSIFANKNYPVTSGQVTLAHSIELPLLRGTSCPVYFKKGTPFLLLVPTGLIEDGYLIYI